MRKNTKKSLFIFCFQFIFWLGFTYITKDNEEWNWLKNVIISLVWAAWMAFIDHQMRKNNQLYLTSGQSAGLIKYLTSEGYVQNKKKGDTIYFKKPGWSFNPFRYTTVKESAFYTLIVASDSIIEKIPKHIERIRQPLS